MEDISQIPLFSSLDAERGLQFGRRCTWRTYEPNELVIDFDDDSTDVRFILSGGVRIIHRIATGKEVILGELGVGQFFGEIAAIDGMRRSANVTALHRSEMCVMPRAVFMDILDKDANTNHKVLCVLVDRIRSLNLRLAEHSFLQVKHRLYSELLRLSHARAGNKEQRSISTPPVQKDLADRIGSRREVVSRELSKLEKAGIIEKNRGALVIVKVDELNRMISEGWDQAD